jgi:hypothetical protein
MADAQGKGKWHHDSQTVWIRVFIEQFKRRGPDYFVTERVKKVMKTSFSVLPYFFELSTAILVQTYF